MSSIILTARLERAKLAQKKKHEAHLMVTLEGAKPAGAARKPLSIVVGLDCSGSMGDEGGQKLEKAKKTVQKLVQHMTEKDTLGVVGFSDNVWTVFAPQKMTQDAKDRATAEISALRHMSATNLSGATIESLRQLHALTERAPDEILRSFLLTDGMPTAGEQAHDKLVEIVKHLAGKAGLTTFGYGNDHKPELLQSMAAAGGGNFYFVRTPDECAAFFGKELGGILSVVAQAVKVTVRTKPGVRILEVLNDFDVKGNADQTEAVVSVDDVYSEEKRRIVLRVELPEMETTGPRPYKFADVSAEFQDLLAMEPRKEEASVKVEFVPEDEATKEQPDKEVLEQVAVLAAAKAQEEAHALAKAGDMGAARSRLASIQARIRGLNTPFAHRVADDIAQVEMRCLASEAEFKTSGGVYMYANSKGYRHGRGQTLGAAKLFDTEEQQQFARSFANDGAMGGAPAVLQAPAPNSAPAQPIVQLTKTRNRRT